MISLPGTIWGAHKDLANNDVWSLVGSGAPTDGTSGTGVGLAGPGSTYTDTATGYKYTNIGTKASPTWLLVASGAGLIRTASGQISAADITSTASGKFGHAQGYPLVAAPGAGIAIYPIAVFASFKYATAAYGAGGNTTVNWGAGGAAITGLVSNSNFAAASGDKPVVFVPLSTAGVALVANASLNLVTTTAFTNPGTAAGVINWQVIYQQMTL